MTTARPLVPGGWDKPLTRPVMSNDVDAHSRVRLNSRFLELDGKPWLPISGELHYSRVPRRDWRQRLLLMRASGIDVVSSYVIWLHHEPVRGERSFEDHLDLRAFVELCHSLDLLVSLRLGPWVHAEARNGGLPDWLQELPVRHRTDDPGYLDQVKDWFGALGQQVGDLCGSDSPVVAIQIENELYDQPQHLLTLKQLARDAGIAAPVWTATGWGGADLPPEEFLPVWSGYGDGFWVDHDSAWHPTFRAHFRMSPQWDDPGVGADVRGVDMSTVATVAAKPVDLSFPAATCELGGGMATAYHRRPVLGALDVPAVANAKLGSGSAWQGYYMYAGGTNPRPGMQESQATGYPNDLPEFDYDFQAPVGSVGMPGPSMPALRRQHAFIHAFGDRLATMPVTFPADERPRRSFRGDADGGIIFLNWHQPHVPLPDLPGVELSVELADGPVSLGHGPLTIPAGTVARWPVNFDVDGLTLRWATASLLSTTDEAVFLVAEPGIPAQVALDPGATVTGEAEQLAPGVWEFDDGGVIDVTVGNIRRRVVVIAAHDADHVWVLGAERRVLRSADPVWLDADTLVARSEGQPRVSEFIDGEWRRLRADGDRGIAGVVVEPELVRDALEPPASWGRPTARATAPTGTDWDGAARYRLRLPSDDQPDPDSGGFLEIHFAGDVARLVSGAVVADRFYDGRPWLVEVPALTAGGELFVEILPLHPEARVWLPPEAADRRDATGGPLLGLDLVVLRRPTETRLQR